MFSYGKRVGIMSVALLALSVVPILVTIMLWPGLPDDVPMRVAASGAVERTGSKFELLVAPAFCLVFSLATYANAGKKAREQRGEATAAAVCERYLRNGLVIAVVLNIASIFIYYMAITGRGIGI